MTEPVLVFRGEVASNAGDELIVDAVTASAISTRLAISGGLVEATLRIARLAGRPVEPSVLVAALHEELQLEPEIACSLIEQLLSAKMLTSEVKTMSRLVFSGHSEIADALRSELSTALWPAELDGLEIAVLGTLGSASFRHELERVQARARRVLTCSFEGASCWIGPIFEPGAEHSGSPCPLCLVGRRIAAGGSDGADIALTFPVNLALIAQLLQQVAEQCARGEIPRQRVLHVQGSTSSWHTLLLQPHCVICDRREPSTTSDLASQCEMYARALEAELDKGAPTAEPSEQQRVAFLDPLLGPLSLQIHEAPDTFRELPLVLGSIRLSERTSTGFRPREFPSVMFGTGATERRRLLVAYAEGVERYAGATDEPDISAVAQRELHAYALAPEQTVRFSQQQHDSGVSVRHTQQPLDWSWVYDWTSGGAKLLVHDAVSYGRGPAAGGAKLFDDPFSSGMSAHRSVVLAAERALFELVERDAFMLAWYLRLPLRKLDLSRVDDLELHDLLRYLSARGVNVTFHDLRVDFSVPTVLATAEAQADFGPWKAGGKILSACAGSSWRDAARHALREILGHFTAFALVSPEGDKSIDPNTGEVRCWWPAFAALLSPRDDRPLAFLRDDAPLQVDDADTFPSGLLRTELSSRGLSVFIRRLGRRDIAQSGLVAIRAIVPGLVRLTPTRDSVNFGEPRFELVRQRWNVTSELNPMAHPLA